MSVRPSSEVKAVSRGAGTSRRPTAVVSGIGPNGVLAALTLLKGDFDVTLVEQRPQASRNIHLGVRGSYLRALEALAPRLYEQVQAILSPIVERSPLRTTFSRGAMHRRLNAPIVALVRVDVHPAQALRTYDQALEQSRLELVAHGMAEYDAAAGDDTFARVRQLRRQYQLSRAAANTSAMNDTVCRHRQDA